MFSIKKILIKIYNIPAKLIFKNFGKNSKVYWPCEFQNGKYISIGNNCYIKKYAWIQVIKLDSIPNFELGDFSYINRFCQIVVTKEVIIGRHVTIGDNVFIADTTHTYKDIEKPISAQNLEFINTVYIGDGAWIGRNASVMGCKIGKNSVIGNSAFVTKDVPDYCVVVGNPAKIIKRYNFETKQWEKTDENGNFLN